MSAQDPRLNDLKLDYKDPAPGGVVEVTIQANGELDISPETITLTNRVHTVRWRCVGLARGEILQIHFLQDSKGPFLSLESVKQIPEEVNGYGNRGPEDTVDEYKYEARILKETKVMRAALGYLTNKATRRVNHPHSGGTGDPPPDPWKPPK